eukprot:TRINITY_DN1972_c0_g2_i1.p1 TRINITY_DN1972_c0_g2~~TRINITY_DN1972_c0_g2_i1.p1  ORF type:complete len:601 (+),score=54.10 TRINITY_DN1972_c0_g2_i1:109-1911(+)
MKRKHSGDGLFVAANLLIKKYGPRTPAQRLLTLYVVLVLALGYALMLYVVNRTDGELSSMMQSKDKGYLMFQACNGFANQRLSIVFGILAGIISDRNVVLPRLPLDGEQKGAMENVDGFSAEVTARFREVYNVQELKRILIKYSIYLVEYDDFHPDKVHSLQCSGLSINQCLKDIKKTRDTVNVGCGFPSNLISGDTVRAYEPLFLDILNALVPQDHILKEIQHGLDFIKHRSQSSDFNLLHLRVEEDWMQHCQAWGNIPDGIIRDNCMNNTEIIGSVLANVIDNVKTPLVICYNADVDNQSYKFALKNLLNNGFHTIVTNKDLVMEHHYREIKAMISYFIALQAKQFIGNSVSSFSALLILERRSQEKWANYYNGGNIPMQHFVPLFQMPWVLAYDCMQLEDFKQNVLPVLIQGMVVGQLDSYLYCHTESPPNPEILKVAKTNNIRVIKHQDIYKYLNDQITTLYAISMVPWLKQYNYMFYTTQTIWFEKQISLDSFRLPLPKFQRDYIENNVAMVRLINTQYVRDVLTKSTFKKQQLSGMIQKQHGGDLVDKYSMISRTPMTYIGPDVKLNKWQLMKNCKYEEFTHLGSQCIDSMELQ